MIFLYLLDNETSFVILASTFVGIIIEFWKARNQRPSRSFALLPSPHHFLPCGFHLLPSVFFLPT